MCVFVYLSAFCSEQIASFKTGRNKESGWIICAPFSNIHSYFSWFLWVWTTVAILLMITDPNTVYGRINTYYCPLLKCSETNKTHRHKMTPDKKHTLIENWPWGVINKHKETKVPSNLVSVDASADRGERLRSDSRLVRETLNICFAYFLLAFVAFLWYP